DILATLVRERRQAKVAFDAFQPSEIDTLKQSIVQAKEVLALEPPLETHLDRLESYLPVAEGITASHTALSEAIGGEALTMTSDKDWSALLAKVTPLYERFHSQFEALQSFKFDTSESLSALGSADEVLTAVDDADILLMPYGTSDLSLAHKRQYRQMEVANGLVRTLLDLVGAIVDRERDIRSFSKRLQAIKAGATDQTDQWERLCSGGEATVEYLTALSAASETARQLLKGLNGHRQVTAEDIEDLENDRDILSLRIKSRKLSADAKQALTQERAEIEREIQTKKTNLSSHSAVTEQLQPYLLFPEVAEGLKQPLKERVMEKEQQHPCDWGHGIILTAQGLKEGRCSYSALSPSEDTPPVPTCEWEQFTFDKNHQGSQVTLSCGDKTATGRKGSNVEAQVIGTATFTAGVHKWIVVLDDRDNGAAYGFGVAPASFNIHSQNYYAAFLIGTGGGSTNYLEGGFKGGERTLVTLDMDKHTISFAVNGVHKGTLTGLPDAVRPWFWIYGQQFSLVFEE
ncbi:hypothetical protein KIPB_006498, partial [Kipferlia bialata]